MSVLKGHKSSHSHSWYVKMIVIMISAQSCYYCALWSCKKAGKIDNNPWWASPLLKASQLKLNLLHCGFPASLHISVHVFIMRLTSLLPLCVLVDPIARAIAGSLLLSGSLSPVFLSPHSVSFSGNRSWALLIFIPPASQRASCRLCLLFMLRAAQKGFFRSVKYDQLRSLLDFNFQNFNSWSAADIGALPPQWTKGIFKALLEGSY